MSFSSVMSSLGEIASDVIVDMHNDPIDERINEINEQIEALKSERRELRNQKI